MLGQLLAQFELKGRDLHGVQADGGVIGQRRARVHESQRHGLQQLKVQVLEESRYFKLSLRGGTVEGHVLSLQVTVQSQTVNEERCVWRRRLGVLLVLDAAQVHKVEVTRESGLKRSKGLQGRDAPSFGQDGQCQNLVVQDGIGHVTEYRGEASCPNIHHLVAHGSPLQQQSEAVDCLFVVLQALAQPAVIILHQSSIHNNFEVATL